ncbi:MAG: GTP 3',8-cyclase MoaA [Epsilonproteobacteria bacterium]|nr:GTP 3',8-cyclase MoaA [Campylobacterota bacterium]
MLIDGHNRKVDYLRISVTERCNFRCQYCMPEKPFSWVPHENLLCFEDLFLFVKASIDEGIKKIRLTGGEPLLRKDLHNFVSMIHNYAPHIDLAITTNGYLLKEYATLLKEAGLKRINISLDSLNKETAHYIAKKDVLEKVLEGIEEAAKVGLKIKINCVPLKGVNDGEIITLLEYCNTKGYEIRFIEFMENAHASVKQGLNSSEIQEIIASKYKFTKEERKSGSPSQGYILEDGYVFGIIEPHLDSFCNDCNRIRLTAEGYLIPCLYFEDALSIADAIKDKNIPLAVEILKTVLQNKPEKNKWGTENDSSRAFYETGG